MADLNRLQLTLDLEANAAALAMACVHEVPPDYLDPACHRRLSHATLDSVHLCRNEAKLYCASLNQQQKILPCTRSLLDLCTLSGWRSPPCCSLPPCRRKSPHQPSPPSASSCSNRPCRPRSTKGASPVSPYWWSRTASCCTAASTGIRISPVTYRWRTTPCTRS